MTGGFSNLAVLVLNGNKKVQKSAEKDTNFASICNAAEIVTNSPLPLGYGAPRRFDVDLGCFRWSQFRRSACYLQ